NSPGKPGPGWQNPASTPGCGPRRSRRRWRAGASRRSRNRPCGRCAARSQKVYERKGVSLFTLGAFYCKIGTMRSFIGGVNCMGLKYNRILLKISGEALGGEKGMGFDEAAMDAICGGVKKAYDLGVQIGIVVGGGNFWRGRTSGK